jgi:hypothetical protein
MIVPVDGPALLAFTFVDTDGQPTDPTTVSISVTPPTTSSRGCSTA